MCVYTLHSYTRYYLIIEELDDIHCMSDLICNLKLGERKHYYWQVLVWHIHLRLIYVREEWDTSNTNMQYLKSKKDMQQSSKKYIIPTFPATPNCSMLHKIQMNLPGFVACVGFFPWCLMKATQH